VDELLTMVRLRGMRRVSVIYESADREVPDFRPIVEWDRARDSFELNRSQRLPALLDSAPGPVPGVERATEFIEMLVAEDTRHLEDVMAAVASFYEQI
jgi:hypothetical protein